MHPLFYIIPLLLSVNFCYSAHLPVLWKGRIQAIDLQSIIVGEEKTEYAECLHELKGHQLTPYEIEKQLEAHFPIQQRLKQFGSHLPCLPSKFSSLEWFGVQALGLKVYNAQLDAMEPIKNFTLYSDDSFLAIQEAFIKWNADRDSGIHFEQLIASLQNGYGPLAGQLIEGSDGDMLKFPSLFQLRVESFYHKFPGLEVAICLYGVALFLFYYNSRFALSCFMLAFFLHSGLIGARTYILQRPPVTNMSETVLYVPWISSFLALVHGYLKKVKISLIAASAASVSLLLTIKLTSSPLEMETVQPILNSQFWLTSHVLLVVASYGIYLLAAIFAHLFLLKLGNQKVFINLISQSIYLGTFFLMIGTILGGVWAAESWGRFWDWDPKESWAFISICTYLIWIHAYQKKLIAGFGLAIGAIIGFLSISFTWYGVNYILGTGFHSYGFGNGGQIYYYLFLLVEIVFVLFTLLYYRKINFS